MSKCEIGQSLMFMYIRILSPGILSAGDKKKLIAKLIFFSEYCIAIGNNCYNYGCLIVYVMYNKTAA